MECSRLNYGRLNTKALGDFGFEYNLATEVGLAVAVAFMTVVVAFVVMVVAFVVMVVPFMVMVVVFMMFVAIVVMMVMFGIGFTAPKQCQRTANYW
ncbi:MAG: hypothetical protein HDT04_05480 [Bacteroidales bacterium]|nr:hypothetical protein [Bacteroidales bacterium]